MNVNLQFTEDEHSANSFTESEPTSVSYQHDYQQYEDDNVVMSRRDITDEHEELLPQSALPDVIEEMSAAEERRRILQDDGQENSRPEDVPASSAEHHESSGPRTSVKMVNTGQNSRPSSSHTEVQSSQTNLNHYVSSSSHTAASGAGVRRSDYGKSDSDPFHFSGSESSHEEGNREVMPGQIGNSANDTFTNIETEEPREAEQNNYVFPELENEERIRSRRKNKGGIKGKGKAILKRSAAVESDCMRSSGWKRSRNVSSSDSSDIDYDVDEISKAYGIDASKLSLSALRLFALGHRKSENKKSSSKQKSSRSSESEPLVKRRTLSDGKRSTGNRDVQSVAASGPRATSVSAVPSAGPSSAPDNAPSSSAASQQGWKRTRERSRSADRRPSGSGKQSHSSRSSRDKRKTDGGDNGNSSRNRDKSAKSHSLRRRPRDWLEPESSPSSSTKPSTSGASTTTSASAKSSEAKGSSRRRQNNHSRSASEGRRSRSVRLPGASKHIKSEVSPGRRDTGGGAGPSQEDVRSEGGEGMRVQVPSKIIPRERRREEMRLTSRRNNNSSTRLHNKIVAEPAASSRSPQSDSTPGFYALMPGFSGAAETTSQKLAAARGERGQGQQGEMKLMNIADLPTPLNTLQLLELYNTTDESDSTWSPRTNGALDDEEEEEEEMAEEEEEEFNEGREVEVVTDVPLDEHFGQ